MKVTVDVNCGYERRSYELPVGLGDKTFKWLGSCASQMFSKFIPNGLPRRREDFRGVTKQSQYNIAEVVLANGEIPHPMSLLQDYVLDGDVIQVVLVKNLPIEDGGIAGTSTYQNLSNVNSTVSPLYVDDSMYLQDDNEALYGEDVGIDAAHIEVNPDDFKAKERERQSAALYMRVVLDSQMLDMSKVKSELMGCWTEVHKLMPTLSKGNTLQMKHIFEKNFSMLDALYRHYTHEENFEMSRLKFKEMIANANIYPKENEFDEITMRIYRLVSKGETKISFGQFLASLILLAQSRFHNILHTVHDVTGAVESLTSLFDKFLFPLASKFRLRIRDLLYKDNTLEQIRLMYDKLFELFEKYASKAQRDLTLSMPVQYMAEMLRDSRIIVLAEDEDEPDKPRQIAESIAEDLLLHSRRGYIKGRHIISEEFRSENDLPPAPEDEYIFPEFVEGIARATFYLLDETDKIMFEEDHMLDGFSKCLKLLEVEEKPVEDKSGSRRGRK